MSTTSIQDISADEIVPLVRYAWLRAVGGMVDDLLLDCACENIAADFLENGLPKSVEEAKDRVEPMVMECSMIDVEESDRFATIVLNKLEDLASFELEEEEEKECEMCERGTRLTRHHLIPKAMHGRLKSKYTREELSNCALICRPCHNAVHHFFTEKELATNYNTVEKLLQTEPLQKHAQWASKQKIRIKARR